MLIARTTLLEIPCCGSNAGNRQIGSFGWKLDPPMVFFAVLWRTYSACAKLIFGTKETKLNVLFKHPILKTIYIPATLFKYPSKKAYTNLSNAR